MTTRRLTSRRPKRQVTQSGFTLLEVMLAIAVLTFITVMLFGTFNQTARAKRTVEAAQDRSHTARIALLRMARELEMAFISASENQLIQERRTMFISVSHRENDELTFSTFAHQRLRAEVPEADTSVVQYFVEPDPDERDVMNLMRRETRRLQPQDPNDIAGEAYVLCPNVAQVKFQFYDPRKKEWQEQWTTQGVEGASYLPPRVRISLTLIDERGIEIPYSTEARIVMTERVDYRPGRM